MDSLIAEMEAAIRAYAGDVPILPGKVHLDIPPLVENGNAVPATVTVDSPMTPADHVRSIALFNEKSVCALGRGTQRVGQRPALHGAMTRRRVGAHAASRDVTFLAARVAFGIGEHAHGRFEPLGERHRGAHQRRELW